MKPFKLLRKMNNSICILLVISLIWISIPHGYAFAAIINTETVANSLRGRQARTYIQSVLAREEVQARLIDQGINIDEAKIRIRSLTDSEAIRLAQEIEKLPAGGDGFSTLVIASLIVFLVLLITDIVGYTDVFPFVKKIE